MQVMVVDMKLKSISYYDSMPSKGYRYVKLMKRYLVDELKAKKKLVAVHKWRWRMIARPADVAQQTNIHDCGVFVCAFCYFICNGIPLKLLSQKDIVYFRRHIALSISKRTIYPNPSDCWNTAPGWSTAPGFVPYS